VALQPLDLCPPCDIQFIDYAKAVIRNDILINPLDEQGYRPVMLDVFHARGLCTCKYVTGQPLPEDCAFREVLLQERMDLVYHDIERVSRSRTAAYYFLSDNRRALHIPDNQDVRVVDLYDTNKFGAAAERLPREVVLEYAWQEVVELTPTEKQDFKSWNGKTYNLTCGGTLVFDGRGNLLSWSRKPGTEHLSDGEAQDIRRRLDIYKENPRALKRKDIPTKLEQGLLKDWEVGQQRKHALLVYLSAMIHRGMVGAAQPESHFSETSRPVTAFEQGDAVSFEVTPHLRSSDFDKKEEGWTVNY
jgi:hypothetical protein